VFFAPPNLRCCRYGTEFCHSGRRRRSRGDRDGFVLLVTLVLLTLSALAMIAMSRAAMLRARAARDDQAELQRRWGEITCSRFILPQCSAVLQQAELQSQRPLALCRQSLTLGQETFDLTFCDESAKADVASLITRQGMQQAEETVRRLSLGSPLAAGNVRLRISQDNGGPRCFGDVFDGASPQILFNHELGPSPMEVLTCWTGGQVNIHRATEDVLREACAGALNLTQIHLLAELQKTQPSISVDDALNQLQVTAEHRRAAEDILTDSSGCYSLWIQCRMPRRSYWSLSIAPGNQAAGSRALCFEW
jgi:hypothetical protein